VSGFDADMDAPLQAAEAIVNAPNGEQGSNVGRHAKRKAVGTRPDAPWGLEDEKARTDSDDSHADGGRAPTAETVTCNEPNPMHSRRQTVDACSSPTSDDVLSDEPTEAGRPKPFAPVVIGVPCELDRLRRSEPRTG
jgi:hypothetical protein